MDMQIHFFNVILLSVNYFKYSKRKMYLPNATKKTSGEKQALTYHVCNRTSGESFGTTRPNQAHCDPIPGH